jgi:hypothetical protein
MTGKTYGYFAPRRAASWWCSLEDLLWPQKKIVDRVKRRAAAFAEARIDTAINFGFHIRFDFSNYFGQLHGYYANVCEELHRYGIRFMDHYSCNDVERPRGDDEFRKLHRSHRHHTLLFHDPIAAEHAQYGGHRFRDLCEVDVRDGSLAYGFPYQLEMFCHNNPAFLDMHGKYLRRLFTEVPLDGIQVDDMCDYAGLAACGCTHCRERFRRDYGHEIPPFGDHGFWGDTSGSPYTWGNYANPVFRDWIRMKADVVADHVALIKRTVGDRPLMTCCSSTGPILLNALSLDLERMAGSLDLLMLENCGINVDTVHWERMDTDAMNQKDLAEKMGHAPAMAISYTIYAKGGYLGWALSRFWGVANWASTLVGRLEEEPEDAPETHEVVGPCNRWEVLRSDLDPRDGRDVVEVRLASSRFCRVNGWRDAEGREQWDRVRAWSGRFVERNVGYRIVRAEELADAEALRAGDGPLVLDGLGCVSDAQFEAIRAYLDRGGAAWLGLPFGTHDEKGFPRARPLSGELLSGKHPGLVLLADVKDTRPLEALRPVIKQVSGDPRWAARLRVHPRGAVLHLMSRAMEALPHPSLRDMGGKPILWDIRRGGMDDRLEYELDFSRAGRAWSAAAAWSPELGDGCRAVALETLPDGRLKACIDLRGVTAYAVVQES